MKECKVILFIFFGIFWLSPYIFSSFCKNNPFLAILWGIFFQNLIGNYNHEPYIALKKEKKQKKTGSERHRFESGLSPDRLEVWWYGGGG